MRRARSRRGPALRSSDDPSVERVPPERDESGDEDVDEINVKRTLLKPPKPGEAVTPTCDERLVEAAGHWVRRLGREHGRTRKESRRRDEGKLGTEPFRQEPLAQQLGERSRRVLHSWRRHGVTAAPRRVGGDRTSPRDGPSKQGDDRQDQP